MKLMTEDKSGVHEVDAVMVNGYDFGDRLLEDCLFIVTVKGDTLKISPDYDTRKYMESSHIDVGKWVKVIEKSINRDDADPSLYCGKNQAWIDYEND